MHDRLSKKFLWVTVFNVVITLAEFIGGVVSGSLALLSDAVHNLGDVGAILLSFVSHRISQKHKNSKKTFGYKRAEILAAFTNAIILLVISGFLIVEALRRFSEPVEIGGNVMLVVSIVGLLGNFISMVVMHADSKRNLNVKSTFFAYVIRCRFLSGGHCCCNLHQVLAYYMARSCHYDSGCAHCIT